MSRSKATWPVSQASTRTSRHGFGCSTIIGLILVPFALFAIFVWPSYLDRHGSVAQGLIAEKYEFIRVVRGETWRTFQVTAAYSTLGHPPQHASCAVDEKTYDSLHPGNPIAVHYVSGPSPMELLLPMTHLAPCTIAVQFHWGAPALQRLLITFVPLVPILLLWRVFRMKAAIWLFFGWIGFAFFYIGIPRVEPEPRHPVPATAIVDRIVTVKTLGDMPLRKSLPLKRPYQIVLLKFTPPGMDTAVVAVDKVDADSMPNLQKGQNADIVYDAAQPRIARLRAGTRLFPGETLHIVLLVSAVYVILVLMVEGCKWFFSLMGRRTLEAARKNLVTKT